MTQKNYDLRKLINISIFSVLGFLIMFFTEISVFPAAFFLKYDCSEITSLLIAFKYGPQAGILTVIIRNMLFFMMKEGGGLAGIIASTFSSVLFVLIASLYYSKRKNMNTVYLSLFFAIIINAAAMVPINYSLITYIYKIPVDMGSTIIYGVIPFNIFKGILNSVILLFVYKKIWRFLEK
ncbi:MAG: ECF transporter S component [Candidatus Muirbacterium halophilum]|nr:ECF transporter S component [Candidatus Muirbacterium halophilum]